VILPGVKCPACPLRHVISNVLNGRLTWLCGACSHCWTPDTAELEAYNARVPARERIEVPPMRRALGVLLLCLCASSAAAQYVPPNGVPNPAFCVDDNPPAPTLYVDASTGNDANPGTIGSKKATIPRTLAAGTVVQVSGTQTFDYTSPNGLHMQGTSGSKVWIVSDASNAMRFTKFGEIDGTYAILAGGSGSGWYIRDGAGATATNHICVRDSTHTGGGVGAAAYVPTDVTTGQIDNIVLLRLTIHNTGTVAAGEAGGDHHCVFIQKADHVWVLDSVFYLCSGDSMQVNGVNNAGGTRTNHIYFARNVSFANRQSGGWAKYSEDVVMTGNISFAMRAIPEPGTSPPQYPNPGACFGGQYNASRLVIMQNLCTASDNGIRIGGFDSTASHTGITILLNAIWNVHDVTYPGSISNPQSAGTAIIFADGFAGPRNVFNNTIVDSRAGIGSTVSNPYALNYTNNIFSGMRDADIVWETTAPTIFWNGFATAVRFSPATASTANFVSNPLFVGSTAGDFRLQSSSPFRNTGFPVDINTTYLAIHGVTTGVDLSVTPNFGASQVDISQAPVHVIRMRIVR
jgi:hypothetical protein